jgi:hypothetical protein
MPVLHEYPHDREDTVQVIVFSKTLKDKSPDELTALARSSSQGVDHASGHQS